LLSSRSPGWKPYAEIITGPIGAPIHAPAMSMNADSSSNSRLSVRRSCRFTRWSSGESEIPERRPIAGLSNGSSPSQRSDIASDADLADAGERTALGKTNGSAGIGEGGCARATDETASAPRVTSREVARDI
jgi:hypothetical protein